MARYNTLAYAGATYGATSPTALFWGLDIDWADGGSFTGENEGERLQSVKVQRGRNYFLTSGNDGFEPVQVGTCELVLSNYDGRFDPYNASSPLYPNVAPGRLMRLRVRYGATIYSVFAGVIMDIQPGDFADMPTVTISCEDGLRWLQDTSVTTGVYTDIFADDAISALLAGAQWPAAWGSSLTSGADLLDYWWARDRSAFEEIRALSDSEIGTFFVDADGQFVFRNRQTVPASVLSLDQSQMLKNIKLLQPWEVQRNLCTVKSNPITAAALGDIWDGSGISVGAGQTITIWAEFADGAINVLAPVATTDYQAFRNSDGSGANLTGYISIAATIYADKAMLEITNSYTRVAYLTLLKVRGQALGSATVSAQSTATGYDRRPRQIKLDLEWQQDANNPDVFAARLLSILNATQPLPVFQINTRPDLQFTPDLFDPITLTIARLNISGLYRVGAISHEWTAPTGQAVTTTIYTEPHWAYAYWIFDSDAVLGTSLLGW